MMDFEIKALVQVHKQYDWRYWLKICCAIIPVASAIIFLIAQAIALYKNPADYWVSTLGTIGSDNQTVVQSRDALINMSTNQNAAYLFCRNILMITTLGNFLNAAWFINSAFNNKYEGQGKFDNQVYGTASVSIIVFIVLFYNLSLIPSHDILHHMHWYNWMSWMCEHIFPDLIMMTYFFVFYPKFKKKISNKDKVNEWFIEMAISIAFVVFFNVFFVILGYILRAAHGTRIFGEMSWSGFFPYPFYNFLNENKQAVCGPGTNYPNIGPWVEFVVVMLIQLIEQVASFAAIKAQNEMQERIQWMYKPTFYRNSLA